jgi:BirA family biotin operon repressor/biotin-[acetyl-CoA-carboxylase] ligase
MTQWPAHVGREVYDSLPSTNVTARLHAENGSRAKWILALEQTQGVGRRGRAWSSTTGNFAATYLMHLNVELSRAALYSFVAALAVREAGMALAPRGVFTLKWPNDVLLNGEKLAGILLETAGRGPSHLSIGIGVNLANTPDASVLEGAALAVTKLNAHTPTPVTPEKFLNELAVAFDKWDKQFATYGFAPIRTAWLAHAARLGQEIVARLPNSEVKGIFRDVDVHGHVVIDTETGPQTIAAGDIFFP